MNVKITVYLGIYNGEKYLDSLFKQILSQDTSNYKLLVVDNASTDASFKIISKWPEKLNKIETKIIRNPINLGAAGSLNHNLKNIKTEWFITIHQDDFYKPNHIKTLVELINKSQNNVVGVSSNMGSMSNVGRKMNSYPRSSWFNEKLDKHGQFLQNLKSQSVPFPSSGFRTEIFKKTKVLSHSSSFSDTEQTLKMFGYGTFTTSNKETMLYRENPLSESHSINNIERETGAFIGLNRVFSSSEFKTLLKELDEQKIHLFISQTILALEHRVRNEELLRLLSLIILENTLEVTGYKNNNIMKLLSNVYVEFASPLTLTLINNLGSLKSTKSSIKNIQQINEDNWKINIWNNYHYSKIVIPEKLNRCILKFIYKIIFIVKPNHRWKNKWR
jgi:glycosyltransferase involved in cell wall biosynthesis